MSVKRYCIRSWIIHCMKENQDWCCLKLLFWVTDDWVTNKEMISSSFEVSSQAKIRVNFFVDT